MTYPTISIVIPTLNSAKVLNKCLKSINSQDYPKQATAKSVSGRIEILITDGGSTDKTIKIAKGYKCKIFKNPLKTGESAKAIGIKKAKNRYIVLIDSDNILPNKSWLKKMIKPLEKDSSLIGSEPIKFTYRKSGGFIERYSALIGANDPYAFVTKVYDRFSYLTNTWTGLKIDQIDKDQYIKITLKPNSTLPTIGANGTILRSSFLHRHPEPVEGSPSNYFFDIDLISSILQKTQKPLYFAKVKTGIIHSYCESSISKFIRKQFRRLTDYYTYLPIRQFNWSKTNRIGIIKFSLYTLTIFPPIIDSFRGYFKKPDPAWFFHPLACFISFFAYSLTTIKYHLKLLKPISRTKWQQ
ncbi:glycosyltransferase family 2 protein [Patescibacteria group bacterium]|nr:glycosyltransferase family 2 protein [Patescibacteria group bacterium]MCG2702081.1 glycosyltransferase family 2 protein [Candidatus Parcubacteria bacterium]MBU4265135.1 glycosyltransferase family 2 protein [Patescibacteria group bacterium]MBU4390699.1 glycosyltransferase family 2 protein [Patescibacteria group bacterium]MBU4396848.1 glycosyltransferase family 2 protein [Patescibacteria group bacterium]